MSSAAIIRSARVNSLARVPIVKRSYGRTLPFIASSSKVYVSLPARVSLALNHKAFYASAPQSSPGDQYTPIPITVDEYHKFTNVFFDKLIPLLEDVSDNSKEMDVEYANGVLTIIYPPHGTYVINKQPPSRQIWLSSPVSGPKRFDFVGGSTWIYRREGKVTVLRDLLKQEFGVDVDAEAADSY